MTYDIITVGSGVVDAFMETNLNEKDGNICLPSGFKIVVKDLWFATGGGATNTAMAFTKLGLKTGFLGKLGRDGNAKTILKELKKSKIDFLGTRGKEPTGYSVVVNSKKKNRTILSYRGTNDLIDFDEFNLKKLKTKWFYFSSTIGKSLKSQEKLARWASKNDIKVAYNPSSYLTSKGLKHLRHVLKHVDILVLNQGEARDLVKSGDLYAGLHKLGPKIVCVTRGKDGNEVCDRSYIYHAKPNNVKVVERTGAGDAFASGFVYGIIKYNNIKLAMQIGTLNAESVIQKPGAKNGLVSEGELGGLIERKQVRIGKRAC